MIILCNLLFGIKLVIWLLGLYFTAIASHNRIMEQLKLEGTLIIIYFQLPWHGQGYQGSDQPAPRAPSNHPVLLYLYISLRNIHTVVWLPTFLLPWILFKFPFLTFGQYCIFLGPPFPHIFGRCPIHSLFYNFMQNLCGDWNKMIFEVPSKHSHDSIHSMIHKRHHVCLFFPLMLNPCRNGFHATDHLYTYAESVRPYQRSTYGWVLYHQWVQGSDESPACGT